jgi:hypothetical protein
MHQEYSPSLARLAELSPTSPEGFYVWVSSLVESRMMESARLDERAWGLGCIDALLARAAWNAGITHFRTVARRGAWEPIIPGQEPTGAVLVFYRNGLGKARTVKSRFIKRFTEEQDPESDNFEWSDDGETCFIPAGWYEVIDN